MREPRKKAMRSQHKLLNCLQSVSAARKRPDFRWIRLRSAMERAEELSNALGARGGAATAAIGQWSACCGRPRQCAYPLRLPEPGLGDQPNVWDCWRTRCSLWT